MIDPDPYGPQLSDLLEMQRGMRWVLLQEFEVLPGHSLDSFRQTTQAGPETGGGAMPSQVLESPLDLLFARLTHQEIEPSSLRVVFDLLVPPLPILFLQPPEELGELLTGKSLNFRLQFIYL